MLIAILLATPASIGTPIAPFISAIGHPAIHHGPLHRPLGLHQHYHVPYYHHTYPVHYPYFGWNLNSLFYLKWKINKLKKETQTYRRSSKTNFSVMTLFFVRLWISEKPWWQNQRAFKRRKTSHNFSHSNFTLWILVVILVIRTEQLQKNQQKEKEWKRGEGERMRTKETNLLYKKLAAILLTLIAR